MREAERAGQLPEGASGGRTPDIRLGGANATPRGHGPLSPRSHLNRVSPQLPPPEHVLLLSCVSAGQTDDWRAAPGGAI